MNSIGVGVLTPNSKIKAFDYLSELTDDDRAYIMDAFGLPKFSNWKKTEVHDVMLGLHTILQQITNPS